MGQFLPGRGRLLIPWEILLALPLAVLGSPPAPAPSAAPAEQGSYSALSNAVDPAHGLLPGDASWSAARVVSWGDPPYATSFRALWGGRGLLLRFDAQDPSPWHTLEKRDDPLFQEEVVEIFLEPPGAPGEYVEIEVSPANVVCDLRIDLPHQRFDRSWDFRGLKTRVEKSWDSGAPSGFVVTAFLPWSGLPPSGAYSLPPRQGDRWRFNVFRIKRPGGPQEPEKGALYLAWSATGQRSFHVPAAFRDLVFEVEPRY